MVNYNNIYGNGNAKLTGELGAYKVIEHEKDMSVAPSEAVREYFSSKMNVRRRQVMVNLFNSGCILQAGAMQWISGNISVSSGVSGAGNFVKKAIQSKVTGETLAKPEYMGTGSVMLEPTYNHILLIDVAEWGSIVLEDGMFLACDSTLQMNVVARNNLSSAVLGGEGLFNTCVSGNGILVCESPVPMDELIEITLNNDMMKIDGNMAVAWSGSLNFTVEKSTKSLIGSAVSKEGLVNVYRGTGKILMAPTAQNAYSEAQAARDSDSDRGPSQSHTESKSRIQSISDAAGAVGNILDLFS